jgi:hypothetical protein
MSGITDVLFNSIESGGVVTTDPMVALSYELDPSLEFGTFNSEREFSSMADTVK